MKEKLWDLYVGATRDEAGNPCECLDFVLRLAAGRFVQNPFGDLELAKARSIIDRVLGLDEAQCVVAEGSHSTWS